MDAPSSLVEGSFCKSLCPTTSSVEDGVDFPCEHAESPPEEETTMLIVCVQPCFVGT